MIELHHGGPSGHSASMLIALAEKELDYVSHPIDLARFEHHGEALLALNPEGQVPVLVADGAPLTETFFTLLYLDESHPRPALGGADPGSRYAVQKWGKYVETHIAPNLAIVRWARFALPVDEGAKQALARLTPERRALWQRALDGFPEEEVNASRAALERAAGRVARDLESDPWLAGPVYSLADIAVYPHLAQFAALDVELPGSVEDWLGRVAARPAVRAVAGDMPMIATMGPETGRWG
jgi:glutathione S-transferase